jgi:transcriptional regulator with XRE-family HTH domain
VQPRSVAAVPDAWIPDPEMRLRIGAALVLADKKPADVAHELNISARTLERVIAGDRLPREWEVQRLATILEVPLWFLMEGFAGASRPTEDDRLSELERLAGGIDRKLDRLDVGARLAAIESELHALQRSPL